MASRVYYDYTIQDRKTRKVLFKGSSGQCADFLGCTRHAVIKMAERCWASERGFFNSRYEITREPKKTRGLKYYMVYQDGELVTEGNSWECAKALGISTSGWHSLVCRSSMQCNPKYVIVSEPK